MRGELFDVLPDGPSSMPPGPSQQQQQCATIARMQYNDTARLLSVVFVDGSAALYAPSSSGSSGGGVVVEGHLGAQLEFKRWLCGPAVG